MTALVTGSPSGSGWRIVEHRGRAGRRRLGKDWRRIHEAMPLRTSSHSFGAQLAYADHRMAAPDRLRCPPLTDGHETSAVCLLEPKTERALGFPVPVWRVSLPSHNPLGDVVCAEDEARRALIPALVAHHRGSPEGGRLLVLGPLSRDSVIWSGLSGTDRLHCCVVPVGMMHVFDGTRTYDELMSMTPLRFRQNLHRLRRRTDELTHVGFGTAADQPTLAAAFDRCLDLEASGWKGAGWRRTAIRYRPGQLAFFRDLLTAGEGGDNCEINSFRANGRWVAAELCMRTGSECSRLRSGYDERHARLGPGRLLIRRTLQCCCEDPTARRDNLTSDSEWQLPWRPESVVLRQRYLSIEPRTGPLLIALLRLRFGALRRMMRSKRVQQARRTLPGRAPVVRQTGRAG